MAAQKINVMPSDCIVFEDVESGVIAAKRAEIGRIIGVSPIPSQSRLKNMAEISAVIADFSDAYTII